jgi:hypothetical protein
MPHELRNLPKLSHDDLTLILVGALSSAAVLIGLVVFLSWRHRRKASPDSKHQGTHPIGRRRKKKRQR